MKIGDKVKVHAGSAHCFNEGEEGVIVDIAEDDLDADMQPYQVEVIGHRQWLYTEELEPITE